MQGEREEKRRRKTERNCNKRKKQSGKEIEQTI